MGLRDLDPFYMFEMEKPFLNDFNEGDKVSFIVSPVALIYFKDDNGYGVYEVEEEQNQRRFNISGTFLEQLHLGSYYRISGTIAAFKGQRQVKIESYAVASPTTKNAIINVLKTLHGLDSKAHLLYDAFGANILELIKYHPEQVAASIKGVGIKRALLWQEQILQDVEQTEALVTLTEYGLSINQARKLFKAHGPTVFEKIKKSPYFLLEEVEKLTFKNCDAIALANDYPLDGYDRIMEAMAAVLRRELNNENCYLTAETFAREVNCLLAFSLEASECADLLSRHQLDTGVVKWEADKYSIPVNIDDLRRRASSMGPDDLYSVFSVDKAYLDDFLSVNTNGKVVHRRHEGEDVYMLAWIDNSEALVAIHTTNFVQSCWGSEWCVEPVLDQYLDDVGLTLEAKQRLAVLTMAKQKGGIYVLNGAAGCGKTFTLKIILQMLKTFYKRDGLPFRAEIMTPTGKAAQVAGKATGLDAKTIHRAIGLTSNSADTEGVMIRNIDCLIVDEFSMVDVGLASKLFAAIGGGVKVIVVGDTEQLPSIGPGAVLRDMIASGKVPTVTLDVVKRQADGSGILKNATKIVAGEMIQQEVKEDPNDLEGNAYLIQQRNPYRCQTMIADFVTRQVKSKRYLLEDIQVLCPQKGTPVGTAALNYVIQQQLNPKIPADMTVPIGKTKLPLVEGEEETEVLLEFRRGDKVIHIKNNYDVEWYELYPDGNMAKDYNQKGIVNGEMGIVVSISEYTENKTVKKRMVVQYEKGCVIYEGDLFSEVTHAYAMTIHKSQGSQWPLVVSPIMKCNWYMLNRKLFYTMYTRAQHVSMVIGEQSAIRHAIENTKVADRKTLLQPRLEGVSLV